MSNFIVPVSSLPSIQSLQALAEQQQAKQTGNSAVPFADLLQSALYNIEQTGAASQQGMYGLAMGYSDDLHTGELAALKSSIAINFTTSLASTAIRSYNELMRMQI